MSRVYKKFPVDVRRETASELEIFLNKYDNALYYVDDKGFLVPIGQTSSSIYLSDGTLVSDRTLTGAAHYLHFVDLSNFTVDTISNINLNPGSTVDIEDTKYITIGNPNGRQIAVQSRDNTCKIEWVSLAPSTPGVRGSLVAERGWRIDPGVFGGIGQATVIANGLANYSGTSNDIADIDAGVAKTLVTKEWVEQYAVGGSGTLNYIPRWTPDGVTLGDSIIQDDGTTVGIGTAPSATIHTKMVTSSLAKSIEVTNTTDTASISTGVDINNYGTLGTKIGIAAAGNPVNTDNVSIGGVFIGGGGSYGTSAGTQYGIIVDVGANTGFTHDSYAAYITADTSNAGDNIGLYINTANAGAGNHYIAQLLDGNEGAGKVLTSDASGYASWVDNPAVLKNIYTDNGSLSSNRTVDLDSFTLEFDTTNAAAAVGVGVSPNTSYDLAVGTQNNTELTVAGFKFPTAVAPLNNGQVMAYNSGTADLDWTDVNDLATTIYSGDGALAANRTVDGATFDLTLNNIGQYDLGFDDSEITVTNGIGVNGTAAATALIDLISTTKGLRIPRMTTAERNLIAHTTGLMVFDTVTESIWYSDGIIWQELQTPKQHYNLGTGFPPSSTLISTSNPHNTWVAGWTPTTFSNWFVGRYKFTLSYGWSKNLTSSSFESRCSLGGDIFGDVFSNGVTHRQEPKDGQGPGALSHQQNQFHGTWIYNFAATGTQALEFDFRSDSTNVNAQANIWDLTFTAEYIGL